VTTTTEDCWIAFVDIYGLAATSEEVGAARIVKATQELADFARNKATNCNLGVISFADTIILVASRLEKEDGFDRLVDCLRSIQQFASERTFILRGGVAFGEVAYSDQICIGKAALKAHRIEQQLAAPIIFVPSSELSAIAPRHPQIQIPLKNGLQRGLVIVPQPLEPFKRTIIDHFENSLINGPPNVAYALNKAIQIINLIEKDTDNE
jgi:hypothetical protein